MVPSGSVPLPVKVTVCPCMAGLGVMDTMVATGGMLVGVITPIVKLWVSVPALLVASTGTAKEPEDWGVHAITPVVLLIVMPEGDAVRAKVGAGVPVALTS